MIFNDFMKALSFAIKTWLQSRIINVPYISVAYH